MNYYLVHEVKRTQMFVLSLVGAKTWEKKPQSLDQDLNLGPPVY